jgi:hypothetical protein
VPSERQNELLDEFERSGISAMRFAKMAGVNYATFANWRHKRRKGRAEGQATAQGAMAQEDMVGASRPVRLFEAFMEPGRGAAACSGGLMIELLGGARMVVESPAQLRMAAELIGMLGQSARRSC